MVFVSVAAAAETPSAAHSGPEDWHWPEVERTAVRAYRGGSGIRR